jgi:glycosyltransferase involved in cell wall biosynthesis
MRKYTILHTIETGGPGGAETVVWSLASLLDHDRFRSLALLPGGSWLPAKLREREVPTQLVDSKAWYDPSVIRAMVRLVKQEGVDLIHSHLPDQNFYSCLAGRVTGRKTIVTYHGPVELTYSKGIKGSTKLWFVRHSASAVVVVCDYVGRLLKEKGFPPEKIQRIYNGINVDRFSLSRVGKLRKELGCSENTRVVGMVANIRVSKGYEFFIRAAGRVIEVFPETRFVAVGDIDQTLGRPLFSLVHELGLQDRFFFLGFREDIPEVLSELDVFVLSSISEGFPLVTLEAMAAGKPVVVTRCGGPEEVIDDGQTGALVPPADPEALAGKICELLADPARAEALGEAARAKAHRLYSLEQMIRQYESLYLRILNSR